MTVYHVCHGCAAAIVNDDYSSFDDDDYVRVAAFVESVGFLAYAGEVSQPGYWDCEACWQAQVGPAYALESLD